MIKYIRHKHGHTLKYYIKPIKLIYKMHMAGCKIKQALRLLAPGRYSSKQLKLTHSSRA